MTLPDNIQQIFNQYQRQVKINDTVQRHETENFIRGWMPQYNIGFVMYSALSENNADDIIKETIAFYVEKGADEFEWKYYDYDTPTDLPQRLIKFGIEPDDVEAVMILDMEQAPAKLLSPATHDIRKIEDVETLQDADKIHHKVWDSTGHPVTERVASMWETNRESVSLYIAYVDDIPVSYGRVEFMPSGNPFASIWGGATLPDYRGRGLYSALVASRLQEAKERGYRYLTVDANPNTSMPILQKLGFEHFAYSTPYIWTNPNNG